MCPWLATTSDITGFHFIKRGVSDQKTPSGQGKGFVSAMAALPSLSFPSEALSGTAWDKCRCHRSVLGRHPGEHRKSWYNLGWCILAIWSTIWSYTTPFLTKQLWISWETASLLVCIEGVASEQFSKAKWCGRRVPVTRRHLKSWENWERKIYLSASFQLVFVIKLMR